MEDKQGRVGERCSNRRVLRPLQQGNRVSIQPIQAGRRELEQTTVTKRLVRRSYEVTTNDGRKYRRNRQFLRESPRPREINVQRSPLRPSQFQTRQSASLHRRVLTKRTRERVNRHHTTPFVAERDTTIRDENGKVVKPVRKLNLWNMLES